MEYQKCLVELDEILRHLSEEELMKIPYDVKQAIKEEKDKQYKWYYDESKKLNEQDLDRKTIAMLSYLNMEYLLNEEQKAYMEKLHEINEEKCEEKKKEKYDSDDLFKNKIKNYDSVALIEVKKNKWYEKIITFLKKILNITESDKSGKIKNNKH